MKRQPKIYYTKIGRQWATWSQDVTPTFLIEVSSRKEAAIATKQIARVVGRKYGGYALTPEQNRQAQKQSAARDRLARQKMQELDRFSEPWERDLNQFSESWDPGDDSFDGWDPCYED